MKTDTLTGPNLSMQVALLDGRTQVAIEQTKYGLLCYAVSDGALGSFVFDCADPKTFQPIAEREKISVRWNMSNDKWLAVTNNKKPDTGGSRYLPTISTFGNTEAEARMRCYVKSYLGDDTKGD